MPFILTAKDISGHLRQVYLCKESFEEDFSFELCHKNYFGRATEFAYNSPDVSKDTSEWYTVCGKPHSDKPGFLKAIGVLGLLGSVTYTRALSPLLYL